MLEILKTHLRKKTAELAAKHGVQTDQIEIVWYDNDFYYRVEKEGPTICSPNEIELIKLSL